MTTIPTSGAGSRSAGHAGSPPPATTSRTFTAVAVITATVTTLALLWAYYVDSPWKHQAQPWGLNSEQGVSGLLWIGGFVLLGVCVIYGVVVRRALIGEPVRAARLALILSVLAVPLAVVAFWTGLPILLGSAAAYLGLDARARLGRTPPTAAVAIGLGLLMAAIALFLCVTG